MPKPKTTRIRVNPVGKESDHDEGFRVLRENGDQGWYTPIAGFYGHDAKVYLDAFMATLYAGLYLSFSTTSANFEIDGWTPK